MLFAPVLLAMALAGDDVILRDGFDADACPAGRIETSDVVYPEGTVSDQDVTVFENLWGRWRFDDPPLPFPGSGAGATIVDFPMHGYIAAKTRIPAETPDYYTGLYTYGSEELPDNPHIDFSISSQCADFSHSLGDCVAFDVAAPKGRLVHWSFIAQDTYPDCVLQAGRDYFLNIRITDPTVPSPSCPRGVCAIRVWGSVALP